MPKRANAICCSSGCSEIRHKQILDGYKIANKQLRAEKEKKITLSNAAKIAKEAGMTYGQYEMQKYVAQMERGVK